MIGLFHVGALKEQRNVLVIFLIYSDVSKRKDVIRILTTRFDFVNFIIDYSFFIYYYIL